MKGWYGRTGVVRGCRRAGRMGGGVGWFFLRLSLNDAGSKWYQENSLKMWTTTPRNPHVTTTCFTPEENKGQRKIWKSEIFTTWKNILGRTVLWVLSSAHASHSCFPDDEFYWSPDVFSRATLRSKFSLILENISAANACTVGSTYSIFDFSLATTVGLKLVC